MGNFQKTDQKPNVVSRVQLTGNCPTALVSIAGVPVKCLLDTGAVTSLVSNSFYKNFLKNKISSLDKSISSYVNVIGANGLEIPVIGVVDVPLTLGGKTLVGSLLVKEEPLSDTPSQCGQCPVLLGCNVLRDLVNSVGGIDTLGQNWHLVSEVLKLSSRKEESGPSREATPLAPVFTGDTWEVLPPSSVRIVNCRLDNGSPRSLTVSHVLIEPSHFQSDSVFGQVTKGMDILSGYQEGSHGQCGVALRNVTKKPILLPPCTQVATANIVEDTCEVHVQSVGVDIEVSVLEVANLTSEGAPSCSPSQETVPEAFSTEIFDSPEVPDLHIDKPFELASELPPGLKLGHIEPGLLPAVVELVVRNKQAFSQGPLDLGECNIIPHEIHLTDDTPISLPHRRISPHQIQEVREHIQSLLDQGIIQKSVSSFASPIVPVRKKDGSLRFCVDYRKLNEKTVRDAFPLPRIEESLEALGGSKWFSSLDLAHGYFQVTVDSKSIPLTAFRVPWGLFEFRRLPQGLVNSPGTFQRIMEYVFGDLNMSKLLLYLDDILIFASSFENHLENLETVFQRLIAAGLKLNGKKCHLLCKQVTYLGHVVSENGISVDESKVERIKLWPTPKTREEVASFVGLASYYRRFVPRFSSIAAPLNALKSGLGNSASSKSSFEWSEEADIAFRTLKQALISAPVLAYPQFGTDFHLEIDASLQGLGACLSQADQNGHLHPVAYASRSLRGAEKNCSNYSSFKLELLGLKWAVVDKFGDLLMGHHCLVLTDNNPLAHLSTARLGATEQRWVAKLSLFDLAIRYRSGTANRVADALSRYPRDETVDIQTVLADATLTSGIPFEIQQHYAELHINSTESVPDNIPTVLPSYSKDHLAEMQQKDEALGLIWNRKVLGWELGQEEPDQGTPSLYSWMREYTRYVFYKDLLHRRVDDPVHGITYQLLVPSILQPVLIETAHNKWGHQGVSRTYSLLKQRCYWPGLHWNVKQYVNKCLDCTVAKAPTPKVRAPMKHLLAFQPLELVALDFVKLDRGKGGAEDVLTITDSFTKWAQAVPCRDQTASTVARVLRDHWFTVYGVPSRIHSDQGRNFEGDLIRELCRMYGIQKSRTTPYHPSGNGQTERFNKTLCSLIKSLEHSKRHQWPELLSYLTFMYNTTPHSVTGIEPYTLMFGRRPQIPLDHLISNLPNDYSVDYVSNQSTFLKRVYDIVKQRLEKAASIRKQRYDSKAHLPSLDIGSRVLLQKTGFKDRHKLEDHYNSDPYVVLRRNDSGELYEIRPALGGQSRWVNAKMIIPDPRGISDVCDDSDFDSVPLIELPESSDSEASDSESDEFDMPYLYSTQTVDPPVEIEPIIEPIDEQPIPVPRSSPRRSSRSTKGQHSNPYAQPKSVLAIEYHPLN